MVRSQNVYLIGGIRKFYKENKFPCLNEQHAFIMPNAVCNIYQVWQSGFHCLQPWGGGLLCPLLLVPLYSVILWCLMLKYCEKHGDEHQPDRRHCPSICRFSSTCTLFFPARNHEQQQFKYLRKILKWFIQGKERKKLCFIKW